MTSPLAFTLPKNRLGIAVLGWKVSNYVHQKRKLDSRLVKGVGSFLSAALKSESFRDWIEFLQKPENQPFVEVNNLLLTRTLRGYLSTQWNDKQVLNVLKDSLRFAREKGGSIHQALISKTHEVITLADVPLGENYGNVRFTICSNQRFKREGEWTVSVYCDKIGGELCSIAFSVEEIDGEWIAYCGAIQGGSGANEETIKAAWKAMHGVRAKAMAIFALQEVISALGIKRLLGAGNSIQMSSRKHAIRVPWNKISFNYDKMWEEADGQAVEDGWFELPLREVRRTREEIKANKRALFARRYALFDQLSAAVTQSLSGK